MSVFLSTRVIFIAFLSLVAVDARAAADLAAKAVTAFVHVSVVPMDRERVLEDWGEFRTGLGC